ncbi:MAG: hypothetical protein PWP31_955 [Clostridia bacterium]|nr:hypothetical protein [Clostridia bacterium]
MEGVPIPLYGLIGGYLLIFFARVMDVSLTTLRMLFLVRGNKFYAAGIGLVEVTVYVLALKLVFERLNDPLSIAVYALGFATGNIVGSYMEEKVAVGQVTVQIITLKDPLKLAEFLREDGFGVTITEGQGREGFHPIINCSLPRKQLKGLRKILDEWDKRAFIVVHDASSTYGGFYRYRRKAK